MIAGPRDRGSWSWRARPGGSSQYRLLLACAGACGSGAQAQNVGGPPYYASSLERLFVDPGVTLDGDSRLAGALDQRNVSVALRPHPEYAPRGINAGSFRIYPSIDSRLRYNSNVFAQETNPVSDAIADTQLHVEADSTFSQNALNLFGDLRRRQYFSRGTESNTAYRLGADGRLLIDRLTPVTATLTRLHDVEPRTSITGNLSSRRPIRFDRSEGQLQATRQFNRVVVRSSLRYTDLDYTDNQTAAGAPFPQGYRDHSELRGGLEAEYAISPGFAPFVSVTANRSDYNLAKQIVPIDRDSSGYEVAAGIDFDLTRLARGRIQIGYLHQDWSDARIQSVSTPSVRARLEYFPSQLITLTAMSARNLFDSQLPEAPSYLDTNSVLRVDYEFRRYIIVSAEAGYETADFRGVDRTDRRTTFTAGATYLANRGLTFRLQYIHLRQRSHGDQASVDYDSDVAYLGLALAV